MKLRKEPVDLSSMIETIAGDMWSAIPEDKAMAIEFENRVESGTPVVAEVDRARLFEVLSNLMGTPSSSHRLAA